MAEAGAARTFDMFLIAVARNRDHLALRADLLQLGAQLVAILARQGQIDQRDFRLQLAGHVHRLIGMIGDPDVVPLDPQQQRLAVGGVAIVIDHEHSAGRISHTFSSLARFRR